MPVITFVSHDGSSWEVQAQSGISLMQAAVDNGIDGIVAECGGSCSCATCHCYIDPAWFSAVGAPGDMEKEMLDCVLEPDSNSRLSCQVKVSEDLDGIVVGLPKSQF